MFFSPFSIAITSFGEERANLSAFRTGLFDLSLFGFVCFSSSWCLGRAAICDCGSPWTFLLPFFGNTGFAEQFKRIVNYKTTDNNMNVLQQTAFVFFNPIMLKTIVICNS